jgi:hypothetical protein
MVMTKYLLYKNKLNNMEDERLFKIVLKSSTAQARIA